MPNSPSFIFWSLNIGLVSRLSRSGSVSSTGRGAVGWKSMLMGGLQSAWDVRSASCAQPSLNGSRVAPVSSTHTDLTSVYSLRASAPFSRPRPLLPKPPKGTYGPSTR